MEEKIWQAKKILKILLISDGVKDGEVREVHHHGRCDVGSAWAKGTVKNPECVDIPNTDAIDE